MSWIFSEAMMKDYGNSPSLREPEGESLGECCLDGEPFAQLNVMPTQHKFWRNDKTMEFSNLSRFGLTLRLLTEDLGMAVLTSFLEDFHARTSVRPAKAQGSTVREAGCGATWNGSFVKYDPQTSTWRTHQCSLLGGLARVLGDLAALGFDAKWGVLGAAATGMDTERERIWVAAGPAGFRRAEMVRGQQGKRRHPPKGWAANDANTRSRLDRIRSLEQMVDEPAVFGSGDGLAHQVDRLKAIGNGQVPRVAATAFSILNNNA